MEKVNGNTIFKWLKKREKNNGVQLYESFIYYGVKYELYDCVYMYNGGLQEPYIGKLIELWECPDKTKKVKVHWFFRPKEISKWLGETKTLENEIFFAAGGGHGLANVNPLEAIVDLCNVVCVSKDDRNPQPSDEQLKAAEFVFYRTFDVQSSAILDKMDDKVGGLEIKYVFNREEGEKAFTSSETQRLSTEAVPHVLKDDAKGEPQNKDILNLLERNTNFTDSGKSHNRPLKRIKSDDKCVELGVARCSEKMTDLPSMKSMVDKADKGEMKVGKVPVEKMENKERKTIPTVSDTLLGQSLMKLMSDNKKQSEGKHVELEVACDSERFKEMSSKKSTVDSKSQHEDKSPADVNNLKASGTFGTTEDGKKCKISEKETSDDLEGNKLKKTKNDGSFKVADKIGINTNVRDLVATSKGKSKSETALVIIGKNKNNNYNEEAKEQQPGESKKELSMSKPLKASASTLSTNKHKNAYREFVVTPRPKSETCHWLRQLPWEDRLKKAYVQGTAILLHNVDPDYTAGEVENIIWSAFEVHCDAKVLQRTSVSSPHYAQALIIFKTKETAQTVLTELDEECLIFSDGRKRFMPIVGTPWPPISTKENCSFFGHLAVGKARFQNHREDEAVSTSHFSQPNNIEYDMAMKWRLLQLRSEKCWEKFHEQQRLELENLKKKLPHRKCAQ